MLRRETLRRRFFHLPLWLIAFVLAPCVMLGAISAGYEILASESHPLVGLIWSSTVDPTVGAGVAAPQWQLLIRTDNNTLYFKSGAANTAWTVLGSSGGTVTGTGTAGTLPIWTSATAIGNSNETEAGGTLKVGVSGYGVNIGSGFVALPDQASVPAATAAGLILLSRQRAPTNSVPSYVNEAGIFNDLQSGLGSRNWFAYSVAADAATPNVFGTVDTATGTRTQRNPASSTTFALGLRRLGYVSSASAGNAAGTRNGLAWLWRGNAAGTGGFRVTFRFEISDAVIATGRTFVGLEASTSAPTDVEPASLTNIIGVCNGSADSNFAICAAGAGAQSETTLGANFPCNTTDTDVYELVLYAAPDASAVTYQVSRLNTAVASATGTISLSAQLPSSTTFLTTQVWRSNSGLAVAVGIDVISEYGETVY